MEIIRLKYNKYILSLDEIWDYYDEKETNKDKGTDILIRKITHKEQGDLCRKRKTLITDLEGSKEDIYHMFDNQVKRAIKKALTLDIKCEFFSSKDILENNDLIEEFKMNYYEFIKKKNLHSSNLDKIKMYAQNNNLILVRGSIDNKPVIFRTVIHDEKYARGILMVSNFRNYDTRKEQNNIAHLNKYVIYQEMLYLKDKNLKIYDWGGISEETEEQARISYFKRQFGGKDLEYYETITACSLKGKAALKVIDKML